MQRPPQLFVNCLKPEILHERDLPNPAATLVRRTCRVNSDWKGFNVSQETPARGTERQGGHLSPTYSAGPYRQIRIACSAHSSALSGAGREPCTAAGKGSPRRHNRRTPVVPIRSLGHRVGVPTLGPSIQRNEKSGPPRSAILKRSSHPFPREVLIIDDRAAKASHSCLTDRHLKAQGARIRRRTGHWRQPGR